MSDVRTPLDFHIISKPRGAICNLACEYCYYLEKEDLHPDSNFYMSDEVLEAYTRQYVESQRTPQVTFAWQGGEPTLMELEFYRRAILLQQKCRRPGMIIKNTMQTNGVNLDDAWCMFFREHNFLVGISLDGPREMHDAYRVDKGGKPTFDRVMQGLGLLKKHGVEFNVLTTVHSANADHPVEVYRFLRDEAEAQFIQFIPIVEQDKRKDAHKDLLVTEWSVRPEQYGEFLIAIFEEWVHHDVGRIFVQLFDASLGAWLGQPGGLCVFAPTCGRALAIEHNGDLYACDHYVDPDYLLGNVLETHMLELVASQKQHQFGLDKRKKLPRYCRECEVLFACNGGCPKNRLIKTPDKESGLNYLCSGYKAFFKHIDTPMKIMAILLRQGHPPAEVMSILAAAEEVNLQ